MGTPILLGMLLLPFLLIGGAAAWFWSQRRRAIFRWTALAYLTTVLLVFFALGPYLLARWLVQRSGTRPQDRALATTPRNFDVPHEDIGFQASDGVRLSGWFIPPGDRNAIVIFTHGLFRNRIEMLSRAVAVRQAGYGALLYDSRSHGKSERASVSLGYHERKDVQAAIAHVGMRYQEALHPPGIALMGVSMGAVATLQAAAEIDRYDALILDSPFASLRQTVERHAWLFFGLPRLGFPNLLLFWIGRLAGFEPWRLDSVEAIRRIQPVPLLIIASEGDRRIRPAVARRLHGAARAELTTLELFGQEVTHGAAARLQPDRYARILTRFLQRAFPQRAGIRSPSETAGSPR